MLAYDGFLRDFMKRCVFCANRVLDVCIVLKLGSPVGGNLKVSV